MAYPSAVEMILKYRNPRSIAQLLSLALQEKVITSREVDELFQHLRGQRCSEGAARMMCQAFLTDSARLLGRTSAETERLASWEQLLSETEHYVRRVTGGRRPPFEPPMN